MRAQAPEPDWKATGGLVVRPGHDFAHSLPVEPNTPFDMAFALQPRFALIDAGHRLRLVIKPRSDFGTGDCHRELGPYPCLVGTLPQQIALLNASYTIRLNGRLALPLLGDTDAKKRNGR